jgi:hypothetical protein
MFDLKPKIISSAQQSGANPESPEMLDAAALRLGRRRQNSSLRQRGPVHPQRAQEYLQCQSLQERAWGQRPWRHRLEFYPTNRQHPSAHRDREGNEPYPCDRTEQRHEEP